MRLLILVVLLAVMQAPPPVPRDAAHSPTDRSHDIKKETSSQEEPTAGTKSTPQLVSPKIDQNGAQSSSRDNAPKPVVVREVLAAAAAKDWWDRLYVIFSGVLVIIGALGVFAAVKTLRAIKRQADLMDKQTGILEKSVKAAEANAAASGEAAKIGRIAARASLRQMELASKTHDVSRESLETARKSADAATDNVKLFISKERARLRVEPKPLSLKPTLNALTVDFAVHMYGATAAYIVESGCAAYVLPLENVGNEEVADRIMSSIHSLPSVILPNAAPLDALTFLLFGEKESDPLVSEIKQDRLFVGVRGFIKYRDVFERQHETKFRYVWKFFSFIPQTDNADRLGRWEKCGSPEDNSET